MKEEFKESEDKKKLELSNLIQYNRPKVSLFNSNKTMANRVIHLIYRPNEGEFNQASILDFNQLMLDGKLEKVAIDKQFTDKMAEIKELKNTACSNSHYEIAASLRDQERSLMEAYERKMPAGFRSLFVFTLHETNYFLVAPHEVILELEKRAGKL